MIDNKWGIVALENGNVEAGQLSKMYLMGEGVLQVNCPITNMIYDRHKFDDVKGIKLSSQEEVIKVYKILNDLE